MRSEMLSRRLKRILRRALQSSARSRDETSKAAAARNAMFELALAAEWKLLGGVVRIEEPDITLCCPEVRIVFGTQKILLGRLAFTSL
jgi:hypothetical protein